MNKFIGETLLSITKPWNGDCDGDEMILEFESGRLYVRIFRQAWLMKAVDILKYDFWQIGETIPKVEIEAAWPYGFEGETSLGCCSEKITLSKSGLQPFEYFISVSPWLSKGVKVLEVLVHELVHTVVGLHHYHDKEFCKVAAAIGLDDGGPTALAEEVLRKRLKEISIQLGAYPEIGLPHEETDLLSV